MAAMLMPPFSELLLSFRCVPSGESELDTLRVVPGVCCGRGETLGSG